MSFSCKIILSDHTKEDDTRRVYLQAIIDGKRAIVPLAFCLKPDSFDKRRQCVKSTHPNHKTLTTEMITAIARGTEIASRFRIQRKEMSPEIFRQEFAGDIVELTSEADLITFIKTERDLKRPTIAPNTYKQHGTVIEKLKSFSKNKVIPFSTLTVELIQKFKNELIKDGLANSTIEKMMKILKQYVADAQRKGITSKDPFIGVKIRTFKSNRLSLSQLEVDALDKYYMDPACPKSHKRLLQYFLFSCYTGLRISDIGAITWKQVHDDLLIFVPQKTRYNGQTVTVPLGPKDKKYLPKFKAGNDPIFKPFADQVSNRMLKKIAEVAGIKKSITYHTSRHTFGSLFAESGNIVALQKIMGHGDIKTTMGYVHTNTKTLIDAKKEVFG